MHNQMSEKEKERESEKVGLLNGLLFSIVFVTFVGCPGVQEPLFGCG